MNVLDQMTYLVIFIAIAFFLINFVFPQTTGQSPSIDWEKSTVLLFLFILAYLVSLGPKWLTPVPVPKGTNPSRPIDHMEEQLMYERF
jgi:hypothetical protein